MYTVLPGPCAAITALVGSGLDASAFSFGGFLPVKSGQRQNELAAAVARDGTSIFYESPHRLLKSLTVLAEIAPERLACVARELTKKFEEYRRGFPADHNQRPRQPTLDQLKSDPRNQRRQPES